jgi:hypothetical protein
VQDTVSALVDWWKAHWDQIAEAVTHVWTVITDAVTVGVGMVMTLWHAFGDDIVNAAKLAWGFLSGIVQSAMEVVRGIIQTVLALINGDWGQAWDGIKQILSGVWDGIQTLVATAIGAVRSTIELALSALGFVWAGFWGGLGKVVDDVRDGIKTGVDKIVDFLLSIPKRIAGLGADILKEITGGAAGLVGKAISLIPGFADGGAVTAGRSIVVGERGPELFTPGASGMITPNAYLSGAAAGVGGGNTYITVQVDAANSYIDQRFADVLERHLLDLSRRASLTSRGVNV